MVTHYKIPYKWHTCYNYKNTVTDKIYFYYVCLTSYLR